MSYVALAASFGYLCYGSTTIIHILLLQRGHCGDRFYTPEPDVYRRQVLKPKVDPRAVRVKLINQPKPVITTK